MKLTQARLKEILHYDPETGVFTRRTNVGRHDRYKAGSVVGGFSRGYITLGFDGVRYRAHRLAWFYMTGEWPKKGIDHRDLNRSNNRWNNLREANQSQNTINSDKRTTNKSGFKGVSWNKPLSKWVANIWLNNKQIYLVVFATMEQAAAKYDFEAVRLHGDFAKTNGAVYFI